ncbi:MAG TPA: hypothetical protein VFR85_19260 [Anaeromyxobacteraceae bacterium]|nr:hypothetical protein [Anaeromyxobacteraceae bacterium]
MAASVDQIGDGTWALFRDQVYLKAGARYTARLGAAICDGTGRCLPGETVWSFTVAAEPARARGDTTVPMGFRVSSSATR